MKISCPSCQSKYTIADEKVQGRSVKVRCRKCGETIHATAAGVSTESPPGAAGDAAAEVGAAAFSVLIAEGDQRDMAIAEIVAGYNSGLVTADTYVWGEGQSDWMPLGQVAAIVEAINAASAAVDAAREAPAAPEPEPAPAPVAEPAPAAAPAADLFGAPAAAPSPMQAHAAVREDKRRDVDLFGGRRAEEDVATSAPPVGDVVAAGQTGKRDESSVLFSLSALTTATPAAAPAPGGGTPTTKDDSGLIDLKALAAKAESPKTSAGPVAASILDAAPLLGTPLIDVPPTQAPDAESKKSKAPIFIGVGIGIAGVAIAVALFIGLRKPPVVAAPPPTTPTASVATTDTAATAPTSTDSGGAAPPSTGAPSALAVKAPTGGKFTGGTGGKNTKKGEKGETSTAGPATPPAKAAPPKSKCGCAPTDLACNMACAAK